MQKDLFKVTIFDRTFWVGKEVLAVLHEGNVLDDGVADLHDPQWVAWRRKLYSVCDPQSLLAKAVIRVFAFGHRLELPPLPREKKRKREAGYHDNVKMTNIPVTTMGGHAGAAACG